MDRAPRAASSPPSSWLHELGQDLSGSFTARASGLLAPELVLLNRDGERFGRLLLRDSSGAKLESGDHEAAFEASGRRHRMVADGEEVLAAHPKGRSIDELEVFCGGQTYEARVDFLRNLAVASYRERGTPWAVRLSGGWLGRGYQALFATGDELAVAVFVLWHVAANRRRAFRAGGGAI